MEDKIQEIMGLVDDVLGCDSAGYQFECKRQIQSELRELVERCSVREPLSVQEIERESLHEQFHDGVRFAERKYNITNTTKE